MSRSNVEMRVHHYEIGAVPGPHQFEGGLSIRDVRNLRAAIDGDLAGGSNLSIEGTDYEQSHAYYVLSTKSGKIINTVSNIKRDISPISF